MYAWPCRLKHLNTSNNSDIILVTGNSFSYRGNVLWTLEHVGIQSSTFGLTSNYVKQFNYFTARTSVKRLSDWGIFLFIKDHSSYNKSLFLFRTKSKFKKCANGYEVFIYNCRNEHGQLKLI